MKTIKLLVELTYDEEVMHGDDPDAVDHFREEILCGPGLLLHSNELTDTLGEVRVLEIDGIKRRCP